MVRVLFALYHLFTNDKTANHVPTATCSFRLQLKTMNKGFSDGALVPVKVVIDNDQSVENKTPRQFIADGEF